MKVAILAGGAGSRLAEETQIKPKPMVEIGSKPILWHIMRHFAHYGFSDFVIALGYKGEIIKKYMMEYSTLSGDLSVNLRTGTVVNGGYRPGWKVELIDTGIPTMTGGRIKRLAPYLDGDNTFMLTYGDGVSDVNLRDLLDFHCSHGKLATMTAVRPPARYGYMEFAGDRVKRFSVQPQTSEGWINGGFFVLQPEVIEYIDGDDTQWEKEPLTNLAKHGQLMAYRNASFWQCMDTLREKKILEDLWQTGAAPWKVWKD